MSASPPAFFRVDEARTTDVVLHLSIEGRALTAMDDWGQLSDLQLSVMRVLWRCGEATVNQMQAALGPDRSLAATTVATLLSRLEKKGLVRHRSEGRQYVYAAAVQEGEVRRSMLSRITEHFFGGDPTAFLQHLIRTQDVGPGDLAEVRHLIRHCRSEVEEDDRD